MSAAPLYFEGDLGNFDTELPSYDSVTAASREHHQTDGRNVPVQPPQGQLPEYPLLPRLTAIYKDTYMNFAVGPMYDETRIRPVPLFYAVVSFERPKRGSSPIPAMTVHNGPTAESPILASVIFRKTASDLTIFHRAYRSQVPFNTTTLRIGNTSKASSFTLGIPSPDGTSSINDSYAWVPSDGAAVRELARDNVPGDDYNRTDGGLVLVQKSDKQIIALWAAGYFVNRRANPLMVAAKLRFLGPAVASEELQLVVLLTALIFGERVRRARYRGSLLERPANTGCIVL